MNNLRKSRKEMEFDIFGDKREEPDDSLSRGTSSGIVDAGPNNDEQEIGKSLAGAEHTLEESRQYNDLSPDISSDDIDADWQGANVTGEETPGGTVTTPDQDVVSDIGEPLGLDTKNQKVLDINKKRRRLEIVRDAEEEKDLES